MTVLVNGKEVDASEFKMEGETMQWMSKEGDKFKLHLIMKTRIIKIEK